MPRPAPSGRPPDRSGHAQGARAGAARRGGQAEQPWRRPVRRPTSGSPRPRSSRRGRTRPWPTCGDAGQEAERKRAEATRRSTRSWRSGARSRSSPTRQGADSRAGRRARGSWPSPLRRRRSSAAPRRGRADPRRGQRDAEARRAGGAEPRGRRGAGRGRLSEAEASARSLREQVAEEFARSRSQAQETLSEARHESEATHARGAAGARPDGPRGRGPAGAGPGGDRGPDRRRDAIVGELGGLSGVIQALAVPEPNATGAAPEEPTQEPSTPHPSRARITCQTSTPNRRSGSSGGVTNPPMSIGTSPTSSRRRASISSASPSSRPRCVSSRPPARGPGAGLRAAEVRRLRQAGG